MSRQLSAHASFKLSGTLHNTQTAVTESGATPSHEFNFTKGLSFLNGTAAGKAQRAWSSSVRSLTSGNSETIDVYDFGSIDIGAGAGLDALGQSLALSGIKALYIENISGSAGNLVVGNDGTTAAWNSFFSASDTATFTLQPGAIFLTADPTALGMAVADSTNHLLKLAASGGDLTYKIALIGI